MNNISNISTKIFSSLCFVLCVVGMYFCKDLTPPLSYEPVGPRPFPLGALILIAICCVLLFAFAEKTDVHWGDRHLWKKNVALAASFLLFVISFEWLGFIISTSIFSFFVGLVFGGKVKFILPFSIILGIGLYYSFDKWLDVTLPMGYIFS